MVRDTSDGGSKGLNGGQSGVIASSFLGAVLVFFGGPIVLDTFTIVSLCLISSWAWKQLRRVVQ